MIIRAGLIPGRQGPDQMRALDFISLLKSGWDRGLPQEGFLLYIDLQRAFKHSHLALPVSYTGKMEIRYQLSQLGALYSHPKAQVRLQGHLSDLFPITKGSQQGCSLSPPFCNSNRNASYCEEKIP